MIGTLTLGISNSTHLIIFLTFLHRSYSAATPEYPRPLLQENYVCIATLAPDLQSVCFYYETDFLHHSSSIELLLFPKHINKLLYCTMGKGGNTLNAGIQGAWHWPAVWYTTILLLLLSYTKMTVFCYYPFGYYLSLTLEPRHQIVTTPPPTFVPSVRN